MIDGLVHPAFAAVAERFGRLFGDPGDGGGALAITLDGELVVDIWGGWARPGEEPWSRDTMAMSFSTTKGVASTVVHRLRDQGLLHYDRPVADYWPAFGEAHKDAITVRELLSHRAGLHDVRGLVTHADELLDEDHIIELLAKQPARKRPGGQPGYHGFTYGWLCDGLVRSVTGTPLKELVQTELQEPLGLTGLYIGAPAEQRHRVAPLINAERSSRLISMLDERGGRFSWLKPLMDALIVTGFDDLIEDPEQRILDTSMPAVNGVFTARSLATLYAALATDGSVNGHRVLQPGTVHEIGRIQSRKRDYVLQIPMRWRLGYHQAFTTGGRPRMAFGHFGYGGSGAWADPETRMSLAFVTNRLGSTTTPIGDARLASLGGAARGAALAAA